VHTSPGDGRPVCWMDGWMEKRVKCHLADYDDSSLTTRQIIQTVTFHLSALGKSIEPWTCRDLVKRPGISLETELALLLKAVITTGAGLEAILVQPLRKIIRHESK
jgi:hypothetical protein